MGLIKQVSLLETHGPQAIVLPDENDVDAYLQALEWRRAIIDRLAGWEELAALEKIHRAKAEMLAEKYEASNGKPWEKLELEGKRDRELAEARKCRMFMDQLERETNAWHRKLKAMVGNGK